MQSPVAYGSFKEAKTISRNKLNWTNQSSQVTSGRMWEAKRQNQMAQLIIARMFPHPTSVLTEVHVGSDCHAINPSYSTGEWSAADVFALPPEGFLDQPKSSQKNLFKTSFGTHSQTLCSQLAREPCLPLHLILSDSPDIIIFLFWGCCFFCCCGFYFYFSYPYLVVLVAQPHVDFWTGQCNCLESWFCHLHVASSHFSSFSGLTLLYLPARNEIIRRVDEKLTSLLHLPVALSDGCHSNHYATEQTQWVKDGFECGSLGSQPGYDRTDRPMRVGCSTQSAQSKQPHTNLVRFIWISGRD